MLFVFLKKLEVPYNRNVNRFSNRQDAENRMPSVIPVVVAVHHEDIACCPAGGIGECLGPEAGDLCRVININVLRNAVAELQPLAGLKPGEHALYGVYVRGADVRSTSSCRGGIGTGFCNELRLEHSQAFEVRVGLGAGRLECGSHISGDANSAQDADDGDHDEEFYQTEAFICSENVLFHCPALKKRGGDAPPP